MTWMSMNASVHRASIMALALTQPQPLACLQMPTIASAQKNGPPQLTLIVWTVTLAKFSKRSTVVEIALLANFQIPRALYFVQIVPQVVLSAHQQHMPRASAKLVRQVSFLMRGNLIALYVPQDSFSMRQVDLRVTAVSQGRQQTL